jgi:glycine dehydrogenase subunit 1
VAISLPSPAPDILASLKARRILGGLNLQEYYSELANSILVCATETKTQTDLDHYVDQLREVLPSVREKAHSY